MELSPEEKLDKVLNWLDDFNKDISGIDRNSLEFKQILEKLEKDGFLINENNKTHLSFEAKYFIREGGYTAKIERLKATETDNRAFRIREEGRSSRMVYITIVLAVGTSIAALYYLNELCCSYRWFCFCNCH